MRLTHAQKKLLFLGLYLVVILIGLRLLFYYCIDFKTIIEFLSVNFRDFGAIILLLSSLIEGLVVVGLYFPGSTIILLGATLAGAGVLPLWSVILWTTLGLIIPYLINYWLGLKGGEKFLEKIGFKGSEKLRTHIEKSNLSYLWVTFHPNIAAVAAVIMGVLKVDIKKALIGLVLGQFFWSTFWGLCFYFFGMYIFNRIALFAIVIIALGLIWEILRFILHHHKLGAND